MDIKLGGPELEKFVFLKFISDGNFFGTWAGAVGRKNG